MKLVDSGMQWWLKLNLPRIMQFMKHPVRTQERWLQQLLRKSHNTAWGKQHNYKSISSYDEFRKAVPIQTYDSLKPYIEQMLHGEKHILWPGRAKWFAETSGTSGAKSKFLPVTVANLKTCHNQGTRDSMTLFRYRHPEAKIFKGKALILGGNYKTEEGYPDAVFADISALLIDKMIPVGRLFLTPDFKTALMPDMEAKIEKIAHLASKEPVTSVSGMPTWILMLFRRVLEITGKDHLLDVWPNLTLFQHGGMDFNPYRETFKALLPSDQIHYRNIYNASEGFFAVQDRSQDDDMLLLLDNGVFYEFVPVEEINDPNPDSCGIENVELDKEYAIIISTNSGLWRYVLGDRVKFTSLSPFRIRVTGRIGQFINLFGEIVTSEHTDRALSETCKAFNASIKDYTAAPRYPVGRELNGYQWLVEFEKPPGNLEDFARILDKNLQQFNSDYYSRRKRNMMFEPLQVVELPKGGFERWMHSKGKNGLQYKIPRLSNSREMIEEILMLEFG
ncbi:MAG: GH3 auxin-responsive promoter family protein [Bacteroidota bacterium]